MSEPRRRRPVEVTLLRPLPGTTPVHRLWAETKLVAMVVLAFTLGLRPTWPVIGGATVVVLLAAAFARVPRGALPRLPKWLWIGIALGAFLTIRSSAPPIGHYAGIEISWGGLEDWARITALAVIGFAAAALMSWTTPLAEVAPALARLGTPLRWLHLPVDEWASSIALSFRCLPLFIDEVRTVVSARRLRPSTRLPAEPRVIWLMGEAQDLLFTILAASLRRATELGEAIEARGGFGTVADVTSRPTWRDAVALLILAGFVVGAFVA